MNGQDCWSSRTNGCALQRSGKLIARRLIDLEAAVDDVEAWPLEVERSSLSLPRHREHWRLGCGETIKGAAKGWDCSCDAIASTTPCGISVPAAQCGQCSRA